MRYRQIYSGTLYSSQQSIYKLQVYSTMYSLQQIVAILGITYVGTGGCWHWWVLAEQYSMNIIIWEDWTNEYLDN